MGKTILVGGFGPGISTAVAEKFGAEGYAVALAARNAERLDAGVRELTKKGIRAAAFPADLSDAAAVRALVDKVRTSLGPVSVLQWTAYGSSAGDIVKADEKEIRAALDIAVTGLLAAVQAAMPDLQKAEEAGVLVTNGGLGLFDPNVDAMAVQWNAMGLAVANAAKHKLVGLLSHRLKADGIYVGEVMVLGTVKGTPWDSGQATIDPAQVAEKFWTLFKQRTEPFAQIG
ncbi:MAG: SDR family NAD(P)-dependent oxidoreductase [Polyangiaceae bacterium]|nr:SDR family NAD(P)-dependent oxidoreductase [Polyangiaceae bacterium]